MLNYLTDWSKCYIGKSAKLGENCEVLEEYISVYYKLNEQYYLDINRPGVIAHACWATETPTTDHIICEETLRLVTDFGELKANSGLKRILGFKIENYQK